MYQEPINKTNGISGRDCAERYLVLKQNSSPGKIWMDIGCAEGYFSLKLSLENHAKEIYAYDINPIALKVAMDIAQKNRLNNIKFTEIEISPIFLSSLTMVDYAIYFSTAHLIAYYKNFDYMLETIREIRAKTLFFEMGHSKEEAPWTKALPDMGLNPDLFIQRMLESCGWPKIEKLGNFRGPKDHPGYRTIFRCEK